MTQHTVSDEAMKVLAGVVKPLEWESVDSTSEWAALADLWMCYRISLRTDGIKVLRLEWLGNRTDEIGQYLDWDAARAAGQSDFAYRVSAALDPALLNRLSGGGGEPSDVSNADIAEYLRRLPETDEFVGFARTVSFIRAVLTELQSYRATPSLTNGARDATAQRVAVAVLEHCYGKSGVDDTMVMQTAAVVSAALDRAVPTPPSPSHGEGMSTYEDESFTYISKGYSVPAKKGGRVEYTGEGRAKLGTITGADGAHLLIRMDGQENSFPYHPTWELRYLDTDTAEKTNA